MRHTGVTVRVLTISAVLAACFSVLVIVLPGRDSVATAAASGMESGLNESGGGSFETSGGAAGPSIELTGHDRDFVLFLFICSMVATAVAAATIIIKTLRSRREGGMSQSRI